MVRIQINYEIYDRCGGQYNSIIIEGKTLRSCLLQAYDSLGLYEEAEDVINDEVNEIGHRLSNDELLDRMIDQSGDGSDYIFSILDIDTNKYLYDSGETDEPETISSDYDDEPSFEEEEEEYKDEDYEEDED